MAGRKQSRYEREYDREPRRKGSAAGLFFTTLLLVLAIGVFAFSAWKLIGYYLEYKAGSDEYANLNKQYVNTVPDTQEQETAAPKALSDETETETDENGDRMIPGPVLKDVSQLEDPETVEEKKEKAGKKTVMESGVKKLLPRMENPIDFARLTGINEDIIGWIRLGALNISYPVCQGADNDYYLHRTFERQDNFAGCIFLNCDNSRYFSDQNTIIYGHNMKDSSMFGTLKQLQEQEKYDSNPYFWIFTPTLIFQYRIFSCSNVPAANDPTYVTRFLTSDFEYYLQRQKLQSLVDAHQVEVTGDDRIATLSTCTGDSTVRFVVQGVLEQIYSAAA